MWSCQQPRQTISRTRASALGKLQMSDNKMTKTLLVDDHRMTTSLFSGPILSTSANEIGRKQYE
jgi:hypothetical protein